MQPTSAQGVEYSGRDVRKISDMTSDACMAGANGDCGHGILGVPTLAAVLQLSPPTAREWLLVIGMSLLPVIFGPLIRSAADKSRGR